MFAHTIWDTLKWSETSSISSKRLVKIRCRMGFLVKMGIRDGPRIMQDSIPIIHIGHGWVIYTCIRNAQNFFVCLCLTLVKEESTLLLVIRNIGKKKKKNYLQPLIISKIRYYVTNENSNFLIFTYFDWLTSLIK